IQKREYFDIAMDSLRINDVTVKRELWHSIRAGMNERARVGLQSAARAQAKPTVAEEWLLGAMFVDQNLRAGVLAMLQPEDYEGLTTAPIFRALLELDRDHDEVSF